MTSIIYRQSVKNPRQFCFAWFQVILDFPWNEQTVKALDVHVSYNSVAHTQNFI